MIREDQRVNDRIRSLACLAGCDHRELREKLIEIADRYRMHLDDVIDHAQDLRARLTAAVDQRR